MSALKERGERKVGTYNRLEFSDVTSDCNAGGKMTRKGNLAVLC